MNIVVSIHGIFYGNSVRKDLEIKMKDGATLEKLLRKVGKKVKVNLIFLINKMDSIPIILINGNRIDFPYGLNIELKNLDEISILQSLGGG